HHAGFNWFCSCTEIMNIQAKVMRDTMVQVFTVSPVFSIFIFDIFLFEQSYFLELFGCFLSYFICELQNGDAWFKDGFGIIMQVKAGIVYFFLAFGKFSIHRYGTG